MKYFHLFLFLAVLLSCSKDDDELQIGTKRISEVISTNDGDKSTSNYTYNEDGV